MSKLTIVSEERLRELLEKENQYENVLHELLTRNDFQTIDDVENFIRGVLDGFK